MDAKAVDLMAIPRFFVDREIRDRERFDLDEGQTRKLRRVLRARPGDEIVLFDGTGIEANGIIAGFEGSQAIVDVTSSSYPKREPALELTVGMALIKADKFELAVQKLTEIGASRIVPLEAERSVIALRDERAWERRRARFDHITVDAAEQSERVTLPEICDPMSIDQFVDTYPAIALVERLNATPLTGISLGSHVAIAIGPEGGWSTSERDVIECRAAAQVTLGSLILRSETAAIVAAGALVQCWLAAEQERR